MHSLNSHATGPGDLEPASAKKILEVALIIEVIGERVLYNIHNFSTCTCCVAGWVDRLLTLLKFFFFFFFLEVPLVYHVPPGYRMCIYIICK